MTEQAADVYEIVLEEPGGPKKWWRTAMVLVTGLLTMGSGPANPGSMIISIIDKQSGEELFRHVEDMGDDEGNLLSGIQDDLATMSADEFAKSWTS